MTHYFRSVLLLLVLFGISSVSAATLTPDGNCIIQNCVRSILTTDDGLKIRVFEWKKSDGQLHSNAPVVIFINGFPHSQLSFLPITQSDLANEFRLITFDLRGHGLSDKPTDPTFYGNGRFSGEIKNLIELITPNKVVLVAHSHGGTALIDYIINQGTAKLKGIVLVGAFTKLNLADNTLTTQVFTNTALQLAPRLLNDQDEGDYLQAGKAFVEASSQSVMPQVQLDTLAMDMMVPANVRQAIFLPPRNVSNLALSNLPIPSLVMHGKLDNLILYTHGVENHQLLGAHSKLILYPGIGHFPQYEITNKFNRDLRKFLSDL